MTLCRQSYAIGIDLGGTKTEVVLLSPKDKVLLRKRQPTPLVQGYDAIVRCVADMIQEAAQELGDAEPYIIGVGIPGSIDPATERVRNANSTCLIGQPLQRDIESIIKLPITLRNDADCFTMAECHSGAGQGYGVVFGIIMGTGCGGSICIDGIVREGPHRIAGEWGHICMDPRGTECYCGKRGCVETMISGSGVERAYLEKYGEKLKMNEIVARARDGEQQCSYVFNHFLDNFGRSVGGVISLLDPDAIVIGGGLSNIDELYTVGLERIRHYAFHDNLTTPVLKNLLGDSAGVFGAARIGKTFGTAKM